METAGTKKTYLCAVSGEFLFWLPVERLSHIMSGDALRSALIREAPLPEKPAADLNGRRIPVFSLRELLGVPSWGEERHALVLRTGESEAALLVDEVLETVEAGAEAVMELPEPVLWEENAFLKGAALMEGRDLPAYVVDLDGLLGTGQR